MAKDFSKYLKEVKFYHWYNTLVKKYKNKRVIIYGVGVMFEYINDNYDLSNLNIIGLSDTKFDFFEDNQKYLGRSVIKKNDILNNRPEIILVAAENYVDIIMEFENNTLFKHVKVLPLVKKPLFTIIRELWRR